MKSTSTDVQGGFPQIFATQAAGLRSLLGGDSLHTFEFVEGAVESPPAPGTSSVFPALLYGFCHYS